MYHAETDQRSKSTEQAFKYHAPTGDKAERHEAVRDVLRQVAHRMAELMPESREASLAYTKLEEAMMWANAAIARAAE